MTERQKQCLLTYLGYDPGAIDGVDGPRTRAALEAFTADYGVGAEGLPGAVAGMVPKRNKPPNTASCSEKPNSSKTGTFWDDIAHFSREEFRCPCGKCGGFPVEPVEAIVREAEALRVALGVPVVIVPPDGHSGGSGVRCQAYNDSLKGSVPNSRHVQGKAVDFCAPGVANAVKEAWLAREKAGGRLRYYYRIGNSNNYHMDVE